MKLNYGLNLGGWLSQCSSFDSDFIREKDFQIIHKMGYDHVRVPLDHDIFEREDAKETLRNAVVWARNNGLNMIIDLHSAPGYRFDVAEGEKNLLFSEPALQETFLNIWDEIAGIYGDERHLAFELLNEVFEEDVIDVWNDLIRRATAVIRKHSGNPIIYGGVQWNRPGKLKFLELPKDPNVIFTFHFYDPICFTHQQAGWVAGIDKGIVVHYPDDMNLYRHLSRNLGAEDQVTGSRVNDVGMPYLEEQIGEAVIAARKAGVPLYCGEYGVIDCAPVEDELRYLRLLNEYFDAHGIGRAQWSYRGMGFGLMEKRLDPFREEIAGMCKLNG